MASFVWVMVCTVHYGGPDGQNTASYQKQHYRKHNILEKTTTQQQNTEEVAMLLCDWSEFRSLAVF